MGKNFILFSLFFFSLYLFPNHKIYAQKEAGTSALPNNRSEHEIQPDNRVKMLTAYLEAQNSPLTDSADAFVREADKNNLDWRFVAAISAVESTYGKRIPYNSYNAWGWGIYGDNMIRFKSFDQGIGIISTGLREKYMDKWGAKDVYAIGKFYAASPTWAQRVDYFMARIESFSQKDTSSLSISL